MAITFTGGKAEARAEFFVEEADYKFRVVEAKEDTSTKGNDMIKMTLCPILPSGADGPKFKEQLVFTSAAFWKVDAFLKSCGKHPGEGQPIEIEASDLIGWEGNAHLLVREFIGNKGDKMKTNEVGYFLFDEDDFS